MVSGKFYWRNARRGAFVNGIAGDFNKGYVGIAIDQKRYLAHRLAFLYLEGAFPLNHVDHADRRRSNNGWINLRHATPTENMYNVGIPTRNTTGYKGVSFDRKRLKFSATVSGKSAGRFAVLSDAVTAVKALRENLHGEFANHGTDDALTELPISTPRIKRVSSWVRNGRTPPTTPRTLFGQ
ncbi:HNH endonuclease [Burkholderia sp. PAMC 28687]|uniref:HNH endonuclease n=1 Tax=Burkholderia sp. PAMC 28687 TaxID=1795874 RepID=UPI003FA481CA